MGGKADLYAKADVDEGGGGSIRVRWVQECGAGDQEEGESEGMKCNTYHFERRKGKKRIQIFSFCAETSFKRGST